MNKPINRSKRLNFLVLDGGGVRGLSSLLILKALMVQINKASTSHGPAFGELHPHHVFQLVAGTSTGGLIALMLGKMGMTVDECITEYERLSKEIFGKKHFRGRMTHGLAPARYSGKRLQNCVRKLLRERQLDENLPMKYKADSVACAVICREHSSSSQHSKLKAKAVPICSLHCEDNLDCTVCDAARATSAAPTFFPVMRIKNRFFADGGLAHNNPSFAIYFHYTGNQRRESTRPMVHCATAPKFSPHGELDCSRVRFTNIGTGAKADEVEPQKRDWLAGLIPGISIIRRGVFLKQTLTEIAVSSDHQADVMMQFQSLNEDIIMYERFDANHGVSNIKLDDYNALSAIREKTGLYLEEQETKKVLAEVGQAIADDYLNTQPIKEQNIQPISPVIGKPPQLSKAPNLMPVSSLSSGSFSHSKHLESESHGSSSNHGSFQTGERPAETLLPLDGLGDSKYYNHDDSSIDIVDSETSTTAAPS